MGRMSQSRQPEGGSSCWALAFCLSRHGHLQKEWLMVLSEAQDAPSFLRMCLIHSPNVNLAHKPPSVGTPHGSEQLNIVTLNSSS